MLCDSNGTLLILSLLMQFIGPIILICDIQFGPFVPSNELSVGGLMYYVVFSVVLALGAFFFSRLLSFGVGQLVCMVAARVDVA